MLSSPTSKYIDFLNAGKVENKTSRAGYYEDDEAQYIGSFKLNKSFKNQDST